MSLFGDYILNGSCQLPLAGLVEMAAAVALREANGSRGRVGTSDRSVIIRGLEVMNPLNLKVGSVLVCELPGDEYDLEFRTDDDRLVAGVGELEVAKTSEILAKGVGATAGGAAAGMQAGVGSNPTAVLSAAFSRCTEEVVGLRERYQLLEERGFHGRRFQNIEQVRQMFPTLNFVYELTHLL